MPAGAHWERHAAQWEAVGPPLRPSPEDVATFERWVARRSAPNAILLGVTPEIATMRWPVATRLTAVERSKAMAEAVWPTHSTPHRAQVVVGEWSAMPADAGSVDLVVGDGCFTQLDPPAAASALEEIRRVLCREGRFAHRFFVRPPVRERPGGVFAALSSGGIGSFHVLKWRLAMALCDADGLVRLSDVWLAWHKACLDDHVRDLGWSEVSVRTIDAYRDVEARYWFPTLTELRAFLALLGWAEIDHLTPGYELGERCPLLLLEITR